MTVSPFRISLFLSLWLAIFSASAYAHKPLMSVDKNDDGSLYIEAGFSDGDSAAGHKILIKALATGKMLAEYTLPKESSLDVPMPDEPYSVTFYGGEGHSVTKTGPGYEGQEVTTPTQSVAPPTHEEPSKSEVSSTPPKETAIEPNSQQSSLIAMVQIQLITGVGVFFLFGAVMFLLGFQMGKSINPK